MCIRDRAWMAAQGALLVVGVDPVLEQAAASVALTLTKGTEGVPKQETSLVLQCCGAEDGHPGSAAVRFAMRHELYSADEVVKLTKMLTDELAKQGKSAIHPPGGALGSSEAYAQRAAVHEREGDLLAAMSDLGAAALLDSDTAQEHKGLLARAVKQYVGLVGALGKAAQQDWEGALEQVHTVPAQERSAACHFVQLRCNMRIGNPSHVYSSALQALNHKQGPGSWTVHQPRTLAALAGARASLHMGSVPKALSLLQHVLRADQDQAQVKAMYKRLKAFNKQMAKVEESLHLSFNHQAVAQLDQAAGMLRGLGLEAGGIHFEVLIKKCDALSAMKLSDDAIEACDTALHMLTAQGAWADPRKQLQAYRARARAHSKDNNHEEAVEDLRAAAEVAGQAEEGEVQHELEQAQHRQREWQEHRDHRVVLELPSNIDELEHPARCMWIKKMYKRLAMRWHPDKAKGTKKRAERKMRECAEAKQELVKRWRCKGIR
eukprot:TRINITY_DN11954_c0_g1_i1.p1 TRINITY_DN11954_c0_g1~~TRINITY_DN11954_c0_g1_i1.p1  ORF type:complete len:491 (+),score=197.83 TRINITY_DN11954_c0_g1_i1:102-1574(+)